jgi:hypothetical protein
MDVKGFLKSIYLIKLHHKIVYFFLFHPQIKLQKTYQRKDLQQFFVIQGFDFPNQHFTFFLQYVLEFLL